MADIWSSGVILYAMLYGKYPFDAKEARFARKIVAADYKLLSVRPCPHSASRTCACHRVALGMPPWIGTARHCRLGIRMEEVETASQAVSPKTNL